MENKTSKYFKYALGEIVLVVIGILIALQINNWNEENKQKREVVEIKKGLLADLAKDTLMLNSFIKRTQKDLNQVKKLVERYKSKNANFDTLVEISEEFNPVFGNIDSFNDATYRTIINTGKINWLEKDIINKLLENKKLQVVCLNNTNEKIYVSKLNNFNNNYSFGTLTNNYVDKTLKVINNERDFVAKLTSMVSYKGFYLNSVHIRNKFVLKNTLSLIVLLK